MSLMIQYAHYLYDDVDTFCLQFYVPAALQQREAGQKSKEKEEILMKCVG